MKNNFQSAPLKVSSFCADYDLQSVFVETTSKGTFND
jgi:hypothetical protein